MNQFDQAAIASLRNGRVTHVVGHGRSMEPVIYSGQTQVIVPVLTHEEAARVGAAEYVGQEMGEGSLVYLTPERLRVGDAVFCKVGYIYTHEIIAIRGKPGSLEFQIARHDRKRINGWTRTIYGRCVMVRD